MWRIGKTINNKYRIQKRIGCGSFGDVFNVVDVNTNLPYAAKIIFKDNNTINIAKEFELTSEFDCETLIKCHNAGDWEISEGNYYFIIYELGEYDLKTRISGSVLNDDELLQFAKDLALGIGYLHERKHVHRDIKPANILWANGRWKIADFGITRILEQTVIQKTEFKGTPNYTPPEAFEGKVTPAFDIWSYAVVLMQARTSVKPFDKYLDDSKTNDIYNIVKNNLPVISESLREPIRQIVIGGLEKDFTKRLGIKGVFELLKLDYNIIQIIQGKPQTYITEQGELIIAPGTTNISISAYRDRTDIISVVLPDSVTEIGWRAFEGCVNLESVSILGNITKISSWAFYGCTNLKSIAIPNSVIEIGSWAFKDCMHLGVITIPEGTTKLGFDVFDGCNQLEIHVAKSSYAAKYTAKNGILSEQIIDGREADKQQSSIPKTSAKLVILAGATEIAECAYKGRDDIKSVVIPESVTNICWQAFYGCTNLESISISHNVIEIGRSAFGGCRSLKSIIIPDGVKKIGDFAFKGCAILHSVSISSSVKKIGAGTFNSCKCLETIVIPENVTDIGAYAFANCSFLRIHAKRGSYAEKYAIDHKIPLHLI